MSQEQWTLVSNIVSAVIYLLPVLALFWKVARYTAKMEDLLSHKTEEINTLKETIKTIQVEVSDLQNNAKVTDTTNVKQDGVLEEHGSRITKLEDKTEGMSETLTQIREENSKQTAMLELLVEKKTK